MDRTQKILTALAIVGLIALVTLDSAPAGPARNTTIPEGALVVDVRTPSEFRAGRHAQAINVPLSNLPGGLRDRAETDRTIVVYCRTGRRSAVAKRVLKRAGFATIIDGGGLRQMGL